jgi:hypothetical protein
MTALYDLHVAIRRAQRGTHPVRLRLERREPYPPQPRRRRNELVLSDRAETVGQAECQLPASLVDAARLPPELTDLAVLGTRARRQLPGAVWMRESLEGPMARLAQALFEGPGASLLEAMRTALAGSSELYPWDRPAAVGRISLEVGGPAVWAVPWELLLPGPAWQDEMWRSCVIVRRDSGQAGTFTEPLALPLTVSIYSTAAEMPDWPGWGDGLFHGTVGGYAEIAREMHGFEWEETAAWPTSGAVHHIVFSSDEGAGEISAVRLLDHDGLPLAIGAGTTRSGVERLADDLDQYTPGHDFRPPPRLLLLHDIAGLGSTGVRSGLDSELVRHGLEAGADAVWVVHCGSIDPAQGDLFPMFYRKVLHNWPLDQAVLGALVQARSTGHEPAGWAFAARSGGELSLLLSEAVVAPTRSLRGLAEVSKRPESVTKGPVRRGPAGPAVRRSERALADLRTQVEDATRAQVDVLECQAVRVSSAEFSEEEHSLQAVLGAQKTVQAAAKATTAGHEARANLAPFPPSAVDAGAVRLTQLSLSPGEDSTQPNVAPDEALVMLRPYTLHVQIAPHVAQALVEQGFPDEALTTVFQHQPRVVLDVVIFSPPDQFHIAQPRGTIELPRYGPSTELRTVVNPQQAGQRRLRVCIYYRNTMLQSLWMEATVVRPGEHAVASFSSTVDYVASADLALLDELPRPALNLFTNETPQGDHWLGVFAEGDLAGFRLRSGDTYVLSDFPTRSKALRAKLSSVRDDYSYGVALDAQGHLSVEPATLAAYKQDLCSLAKLGRRQFWGMFIGGSAAVEDLEALGNQLQTPALVSVARCRLDGTTFPWAALYYLDIDTGEELRLCSVFAAQLAANRWYEGLDRLREKADLLDEPSRCRQQAECPLQNPEERHVVCPFGFWGFVHQIEQPLQQVKPVPGDRLPAELAGSDFTQNSLLPRRTPVHLALGLFEDEELQTDAHVRELEGLRQGRKLELAPQKAARTNRQDLIAMMERGGQQVYYFYCHGVFEDGEEEEDGGDFSLKVGTADHVGYIGPDNLSRVHWKPDAPLVMLNGCETLALLPERIHDFLLTLRKLGASGVVGTEIEVFPGFARPFGLQVLREVLDGASLGEAFLSARLHLLRQYNPLGLAYSFYAPGTLHLHDPQSCAWCKAHPPGRTASAPGG